MFHWKWRWTGAISVAALKIGSGSRKASRSGSKLDPAISRKTRWLSAVAISRLKPKSRCRSEERRVGKECRSRVWGDDLNKKKKSGCGDGLIPNGKRMLVVMTANIDQYNLHDAGRR